MHKRKLKANVYYKVWRGKFGGGQAWKIWSNGLTVPGPAHDHWISVMGKGTYTSHPPWVLVSIL